MGRYKNQRRIQMESNEPITKESWKKQFGKWLKEICPWDKIEEYVQFHGQILPGLDSSRVRVVEDSNWARAGKSNKDMIKLVIFTKDYSYWIRVSKKYLACGASTRKPRAGEDWTRGNDLPDGKFCRETWENIKNAIVRYELVKVALHKPQDINVAGKLVDLPIKH